MQRNGALERNPLDTSKKMVLGIAAATSEPVLYDLNGLHPFELDQDVVFPRAPVLRPGRQREAGGQSVDIGLVEAAVRPLAGRPPPDCITGAGGVEHERILVAPASLSGRGRSEVPRLELRALARRDWRRRWKEEEEAEEGEEDKNEEEYEEEEEEETSMRERRRKLRMRRKRRKRRTVSLQSFLLHAQRRGQDVPP
ncbi:unnamed protein product [Prorocentrum cordatum]|uniref:Uncharacterized protein n=1 Tax=Prorocentrum cordatum TaxID=2364126 RepID=A0ABN9SJW7_9DINO|nr:unnamed protein product [Polarella glacialis]